MDLLLIAASIVGFDVVLAYVAALGKAYLKKQLVRLEKRRDETVQKLVMLIRRRKSLEGTRKFLRRLKEERTAQLDALVAELERWERGEVPEGFAADAEEAEDEGQVEAGGEEQTQESAAEAEEAGMRSGDAEGGQTAAAGGSAGERKAIPQDAGDEGEEREINVKAPAQIFGADLGPRFRRYKSGE